MDPSGPASSSSFIDSQEKDPNNNTITLPIIEIYTDASKFPGGGCGIACNFGSNHELNVDKSMDDIDNSGLAEVAAVILALKLILDWNNGEQLAIFTDFLPMIHALQEPSTVGYVFHDEYEELRQLAGQVPGGVRLEHVKGHSGIKGNERVDQMARRAAERSRSRSRSQSHCRRSLSGPCRSRSKSRSPSRSRSTDRRPRSVFIPPIIHPERPRPLPQRDDQQRQSRSRQRGRQLPTDATVPIGLPTDSLI